MSKFYACIISPDIKRHRETLVAVADLFAHSIEVLDDGILFDVSGLERLIGKPELIVEKIRTELKHRRVPGCIAVADTVDTATLLARQESDEDISAHSSELFKQLSLSDLNIQQDTLNVFRELGLRSVKDLLAIPHNELIGRYGKGFQDMIDTIEQRGRSFLTPNIKENNVSWSFDLDQPVENFEQLIFVANHGLKRLFEQVEYSGFSCEHLDLNFQLKNKTTRSYEVKISFPTLERSFWLKFINLRVALNPPEADIISVNIIAHFAKARPSQRGLFAVSRPEPESLLLTVNKLKKMVGETNVGVPRLQDQRAQEPFELDADSIPDGRESREIGGHKPIIAFSFYRSPIRAEIGIENNRLTHIRTRQFAGRIEKYSGVWKATSQWWNLPWNTNEWDIEVENNGVYRLRKTDAEWFLAGEYD